ncbi:hypothetical protein HID58_015115, partial [Brassica napus]
RQSQSHNHELLQILLCWTDLPSISRFRRFLLGLTMAALEMAVLAWLNGSDGRMVNQVWFGHDDSSNEAMLIIVTSNYFGDVLYRWLYSTCIVEGAQRAINTSHFQAESNENGLGFVMLWVFTVVIKRHFELLMTKGYWIIYNRIHSDRCRLIPYLLCQHFISKEKVDSWSSLRNRSKLNGHMVIVLAEEHGKTWNLTDASDKKLLKDVASGYHKASRSCVHDLDCSSNASNTVYFILLAQSVVHGAVAGYTSYISNLINRRQTYMMSSNTSVIFV